jgi:hypothetical protein
MCLPVREKVGLMILIKRSDPRSIKVKGLECESSVVDIALLHERGKYLKFQY